MCMIVAILIVLLLVTAGLLSLFYYDIKNYIISRRIKKTEKTLSQERVSIGAFKKELIDATKYLVVNGKQIAYPAFYSENFFKRFKLNLKDQYAVQRFDYDGSECGWPFYALLKEDVEFGRKMFDEKVLNLDIHAVDQSPYGMVALYLYDKFKDEKYLKYAQQLYKFIVDLETNYGIAYRQYHKNDIILVDTLGMAIPFLIEYGNYSKDDAAIKLAEKTIECYLQYGCDSSTGVPAFSYRISTPHIKCGYANWGRGCAWFVIGLSYINIEHLDAKSQKLVGVLEETLKSMWESQGLFGQFISEWSHDLSAELPIVYYLYKMNIIRIDEKQLLAYSTMCHDGIMYNCSSANVGIVKQGFPYGPNMLGQGYMLRLIQLYEERNAK